uniref:Gustatory receptor n=1 Tax=Schizaphis graminum TaxID=13262 RepID=A0A2S2NQM5_SCHGA
MATLRGRLNFTMNLCRLFALGLEPNGVVAVVADAVILLANLAFSGYVYHHVTSVVQQRMPLIWDVTTVMSVAKVFTYLLTPPVMLIAWEYNKRSLSAAVRALDRAMTETAAAAPLTPFVKYSVQWMCVSILTEYAGYTMFHLDTDFAYFTTTEYGMIAVYNVWTMVPLLMYTFMVDTIRAAVRDINGRLATVADWQTYRGRWDDLRRVAVHLARDLFGVTIVVFIVRTIAEVVFFGFSLYLYGVKDQHDPVRIVVYSVNGSFSIAWMYEIIRMTKNCKLEIKYAYLYMLHADLSFMPCNIFEMNYRSLKSIVTLVVAFLIFQVQMKLI